MVTISGQLARRYYKIMNYSNYRYRYTNEKFAEIDENIVVKRIKKLRKRGDIKKAEALEKLLEEFWSFYP